MKRFLLILLCLALVFGLTPSAAFAEVQLDGKSAESLTDVPAEDAAMDAAVPQEDAAEADGAPENGIGTEQPAPEDGEGELGAPVEDEDAAEEIEPEVPLMFESRVNPAYKSVDFSQVKASTASAGRRMLLAGPALNSAAYSNADSAKAYIRSQFKNRVLHINFQYSSASSLASADFMNMFSDALAHNGTPTEGDCLEYNYSGVAVLIAPGGGTYDVHYYITVPEKFNAWIQSNLNSNGQLTAIPSTEPEYSGYYSTAAQENELTQKVNTILAGLDLEGKSDFEKVRAIYTYLTDNVTYDYTNLNNDSYMLKYTAYAAAVNGTAVCQGYAVLFYRLALECGIDARVIDGSSRGGGHAWNIVELNDKYYLLDSTWDAGRGQNGWTYFLRTRDVFTANDHAFDGENSAVFLPSYSLSTLDYLGTKTVSLDLSAFDLSKTDGSVYIDGVPYSIGNGTISLPDVTAKTAVLYYFNDPNAADRHTIYPQNMYVWLLGYDDGAYTAARSSGFDDILKYAGSSMRLTGTKGVRMITSIPRSMKSALTGASGYSGYTLLETGTRAAWVSALGSGALVNGGANVFGNYAYKKSAGADPVFKTTGSVSQFTNALTFTDIEKCRPDLALRPYMILRDPDGVYVTLYGGIIYRNIGYMAYQNRSTFSEGTDAYNFIHSIINYVYPDGYAA